MARNPDFLRCKEERNNKGFCKVVQNIDLSSEKTRALPHDFVRSFSDDDLSRIMKIKTQWGCTWEVGISKNPIFYFMEKLGWEKFVRDNALGHSEFLTFTHKGEMNFTVNIFKLDGKEMMQPPQSRDFLASSSKICFSSYGTSELVKDIKRFFTTDDETGRLKTEQEEDDKNEEVVFCSFGLSNHAPTTATESNGRNLNFGKKKAEEVKTFKRDKKMVCPRRYFAGASSSSAAEFTIFIRKSYLHRFLVIPRSVAKDHMPKTDTMFKINHPDGKRSWNVRYLVGKQKTNANTFCRGWYNLCEEYPIALGDTCKFTLIRPHELLLIVSKP